MTVKRAGRNDPCPCGSGKKYKQCCMQRDEAQEVRKHSDAASVNNTFQMALAHHQAGRLPHAEALYQQVLQMQPDHPDALHLLGALARQTGNNEIARNLIGKAISAKPSEAVYYNSMGLVLRDLGKLDEAVASYRKALSIKPDYAETLYNLGNTLQIQGKLDEATASYRRAISIKPDYAEAHGNLGNALQSQGELDEAITCYRKAIALKPGYTEAHANLGNALQSQGKLDEAIASYHRAIALKPDYAKAHNNLGWALQMQGKFDEAIASYRKALAINPGYAETLCNMGGALYGKGNLAEAMASYRQALSIKPDIAEAHVGLAGVHNELGQFDAAQAELTKALELKPEHPGAWAALTKSRKMTLADDHWLKTALKLVAQDHSTLSAKDNISLLFAIGKYYDDTGQYDLAFPAYQRGNAQKRRIEGGVDRTKVTRLVDMLINTCTAGYVNRQWEGASQSQLPVLIVGMPRSGTSLTEQVIASHPETFGAGELSFWGNPFLPSQVAMLSGNHGPAFIAKIAAGYEQHLRQYSAEASRIVDKMPSNFFWLGLIHATFPQARIIHTRRNPVDTCLSIYFQNFSADHSYGTDLDDLAFYYCEYARLMQHWRTVLPPDRFLEVHYEALTDGQAEWSRRIIEFIGLDWDERCLDFHKTERKVGTVSNWQVRQKIYHSSKARWRHYEKYLGPLLGLLDMG